MPTYEYLCSGCGDFTAVRPMAECQEPQPCPGCGASSPRALLTAPAVQGMPAHLRQAHLRNEQSAHAPRHSAEAGHGHGCACHARAVPAAGNAKPALKSGGGRRPWMIGH